MLIVIITLHITKDILTYYVVKNSFLFIYPMFGSKFLCGCFVFSYLLTYITDTSFYIESFPSLTPGSSKCQVGKYSTDCSRVRVPLVVVTWSVTMDTWYLQRPEFGKPYRCHVEEFRSSRKSSCFLKSGETRISSSS